MNTVQRIKAICKERNIPIYRLETDLGFGNAYISGLKKGSVPDDRLKLISEYLGLSMNYLITGEEIEKPNYSDELVELLGNVRKDAELVYALKKYFSLSEEKRKHIISTINMISED